MGGLLGMIIKIMTVLVSMLLLIGNAQANEKDKYFAKQCIKEVQQQLDDGMKLDKSYSYYPIKENYDGFKFHCKKRPGKGECWAPFFQIIEYSLIMPWGEKEVRARACYFNDQGSVVSYWWQSPDCVRGSKAITC